RLAARRRLASFIVSETQFLYHVAAFLGRYSRFCCCPQSQIGTPKPRYQYRCKWENYVMSNDGVNVPRRRFLTVSTTVVGAVGVVGAAVPFIGSWNPSAKAQAAGAPVKVNVSKLEPDAMMSV